MSELVIRVNKEGREAVQQLCHSALKLSGINSLNGVNQILSSMKDIPEKNEKPKNDKKEDKI